MLSNFNRTGVTGYIAGDALYALQHKHPEYEYSVLIRTKDKAELVKAAYPSLRIVIGGLDDSELLKKEAASADIILRMCPIIVVEQNEHQITALRCCRCV